MSGRTPSRRTAAAAPPPRATAPAPSSTSWPSTPCTCTSMKPGTISATRADRAGSRRRRVDRRAARSRRCVAVDEQAAARQHAIGQDEVRAGEQDHCARAWRRAPRRWRRRRRRASRDNAQRVGLLRRQAAVALLPDGSSIMSPTEASMPPSTMHSGSSTVASWRPPCRRTGRCRARPTPRRRRPRARRSKM